MATELVHWCDEHLGRNERVPAARAHAVVIDGTGFALDLCAACSAERVAPLLEWLAATGVAESPKRKGGRPRAADAAAAPGEYLFPAAADAGDKAAKRKRSPKKGASDRHPLDDGLSTTCPVCGSQQTNRQGLAAHGTYVHGTRGLLELFTLAERVRDAEGDDGSSAEAATA